MNTYVISPIRRHQRKSKDCKKTILKGNFKRHFERKHKDESKNYSCNICEKQFASKNSKDFHVKKVH